MPTISHSPITSKALLDTAATDQYLHPSDFSHCSHVAHTTSGPTIQLANGHTIKPAFSATLKISSKLSSRSQSSHVFNEVTTSSLISMGQLYDDDCVAIFNKYDVKILKHNQVIINELQDRTNGLCNIPLGPCPPTQQSPTLSHPNQANGILHQDIAKRELAKYFYSAAFRTVKSTFIATINNGYLTSWNDLSTNPISQHLPQCPFTVKGHLDQEQKIFVPPDHTKSSATISTLSRSSTPTTSSPQLSTPTPRPPNHTLTRQAAYLYYLSAETSIYSSSTTTSPTPSTPNS